MASYQPIVRAKVINLITDQPQPGDRFLVDTNVWYWLTYTRAKLSPKPPKSYQTQHYPTYIKAALQAQSQIFWSGLSIAELSSLIERSEWQIFCATHQRRPEDFSLKEYRHGSPQERQQQVIPEIEAAWGLIETSGTCLETLVDQPTTAQTIGNLTIQELDSYDSLMLTTATKTGINQVITDDIDFITASGITVFTANRNAIAAAKAQNQLIQR
ncbi:hypothetical protein ACN4EG_19850 [Alkalinema pantanalense CENA528]|uniref:hypothetical protein n=1 Tax=Alkalinema pantanalense TaxID=1620705 RepID=UPI003D6FC9BA